MGVIPLYVTECCYIIAEISKWRDCHDNHAGQSLGYGFVNYKHTESARKAIESLNGLRLQNKTIKVRNNLLIVFYLL